MSPRFFETIMGKRFLEGTVPKILEQIALLNKNLEKLNEILEEKIENEKQNS